MHEMVSSTYLFYGHIFFVKMANIVLSSLTINMPTSTGPSGEPMFTPIFVYIYITIVTKIYICDTE